MRGRRGRSVDPRAAFDQWPRHAGASPIAIARAFAHRTRSDTDAYFRA